MHNYLFQKGEHFQAYKYLGAHWTEAACTFRVWAPRASKVFVTGDFCDWQQDQYPAKRVDSSGIFECIIPSLACYENYKFVIVDEKGRTFLKADPYAYHSETRPATASKVYQLEGYKWRDTTWMMQREQAVDKPLNIYEVHLGSWRQHEDGHYYSYQQMADVLIPYVKKMHYTHIEIMPILEYPYDKSWGYQVTGYFAPTSRYGTPHDLMYFIEQCHLEGIGVILDWVPAHFPKDAHGLYEFDGRCCYEYEAVHKREHPEWQTRIFDFGKNEVVSFLISSADFWFNHYHIDGMRVDAVASMLYLDYGKKAGEWQPNRYGGNGNLEAVIFLQKLNTWIQATYPGVMMIAEESTAWQGVTAPVAAGGLGFTYKWNMGWMNDTLAYISKDPLFRGAVHHQLIASFNYAFSENYILPLSHDEVVHGKRSLLKKIPGTETMQFATLRAYMALMMAHPGKKLHFMGNEWAAENEWWEEKSLDWSLIKKDMHRLYNSFIEALNRFYMENATLWALDTTSEGICFQDFSKWEENIIAFCRTSKAADKLWVVCNFSGIPYANYTLPLDEKASYEIVLSTDATQYGGEGRVSQRNNTINLPPLTTIYMKERK